MIRSFGPWRLLNTQPDGVIYTTDDDGEWVQIVPLIRWRGLFFPRPEFGGVQLIRQGEDTPVGSTILRALRGVGRWIPPEDVAKSDFLSGQNILAYRVSRHMANSFRFQEGFFAPLPGYHRGDIRIPDLPGDMNDQPFTAYFDVDHPKGGGKLYHYFALEPFDPERQGLNTSVFVPADGSGPILVYKHHERTGSPTGVSAIAHIVRESRKNYDWSLNRPVEHRPFIKDVAGKRRFFWLTTVVTMAGRRQLHRRQRSRPGAHRSRPRVAGVGRLEATRSLADPARNRARQRLERRLSLSTPALLRVGLSSSRTVASDVLSRG